MRLIIIRHAIAVSRETATMDDADRPLTARGIARFRRAARGLARIERRPDLLLTSPLLRARQTAEIAARAWRRLEARTEDALADTPEAILGALARLPGEARVAIVGHEPDLSQLLAQLLGSRDGARFTFRKGGAACVELPDAPEAGGALLWYLAPRQLRALA